MYLNQISYQIDSKPKYVSYVIQFIYLLVLGTKKRKNIS